ncbi:MAG: adenosine kinase [Gammaproteobacteria bacterium]|jgi:sugar/nucleoside kinase (ribokinase family)|nr:adenosine kinase [Gammaproteobacteria bacterium]
MKNYDVYGIGNALVDTEYEIDEEFLDHAKVPKGIMTLIEEDDRQRLIHLLEEEHEHLVVKQAGGGSAANTMVIISQLGGAAFYSCKVANDKTGDFFVKDLKAAGIDTNLSEDREPGATGHCISMVTPDAERTMTTCLGITNFLSPKELNPDAIRNSAKLYIEGYLVSSATGFEAALEAQSIARVNNVEVSLTLSDPAMIENFKSNYELLFSQGIDLLFCNHDEARLLTGADSVEDCARTLKEICRTFVITCGKSGSLTFDGKEVTRADGIATQAVDTTGAGDIFAGAFLHSLCQGQGFTEAAQLANRSASLLVSSFGARLSQDEVDTNLK